MLKKHYDLFLKLFGGFCIVYGVLVTLFTNLFIGLIRQGSFEPSIFIRVYGILIVGFGFVSWNISLPVFIEDAKKKVTWGILLYFLPLTFFWLNEINARESIWGIFTYLLAVFFTLGAINYVYVFRDRAEESDTEPDSKASEKPARKKATEEE